MEELFENFAEHISKMLSPKMGKMLHNYLQQSLNENTSTEEYNNIECDIKAIMSNYFQNATDKDYLEMATNLFNAYVENDDENLIKSVKYFIRIYSYFQNINLKKKLYKWRINSLYVAPYSKPTQTTNTKSLYKSNSGSKLIKNPSNKDPQHVFNNKLQQNDNKQVQ